MTVLTVVHTCSAGIQLLKNGQGCYVSKTKVPDFPKAIKAPSTHLIKAVDSPDNIAGDDVLKNWLYVTPYDYDKYNTASAKCGI